MTSDKTNVVLIGMPACGKSTIGVLLAKALGKSFIDADLLIQEKAGKLLQEIIDQDGLENFQAIEEEVLSSVKAVNSVIATGGSAIYYEKAMEHLKQDGIVIYIRLPLEIIKERLDNMSSRGIAMGQGETLEDLYQKRIPLYELYADKTLLAGDLTLEGCVEKITLMVKG